MLDSTRHGEKMSNSIPIPENKYKIIYCDCPWSYADKQKNRPGIQYPTMTIKELSELNVKQISDKNSVLCMWCTMPQLKEGLEVMEAWGFEYKTTLFTWVKTYEKSGKHFWGMGRYTRSSPEIILLGKRGKGLPVKDHGILSIQEHHVMKHSEKPALFRNLIVQLFDADQIPKIELFCRHNLTNWDTWGNQIGLLGQSV